MVTHFSLSLSKRIEETLIASLAHPITLYFTVYMVIMKINQCPLEFKWNFYGQQGGAVYSRGWVF